MGKITDVGEKTISRGVYAASYLSFFGIGLTLILPFSGISLRSHPTHYLRGAGWAIARPSQNSTHF